MKDTRIDICTINMNEGEGRQTIYWDTEDKLLHSDAEPDAETEYRCETFEEAEETAYRLWGLGGDWDLEWIEHDEKQNKKWFLIDWAGDEWETELKASTKEEAIEEARRQWDHLSQHDKNRREYFYVVHAYPDEDGMADLDTGDDCYYFKR